MTTMFHIYGDESIVGDNIVYGLVIVPVEKLELAEATLGNVKEKFGSSRSARFHCREVFHKDARRKTEWAHLSDNEALDLALAITSSLAGMGIGTRVGHVVREAMMHDIPGVGGLPSMTIHHPKQLIPYAYQAAIGQLNFDGKYANHCKLWIEPNNICIHRQYTIVNHSAHSGTRLPGDAELVGEFHGARIEHTHRCVPHIDGDW